MFMGTGSTKRTAQITRQIERGAKEDEPDTTGPGLPDRPQTGKKIKTAKGVVVKTAPPVTKANVVTTEGDGDL